MEYIDHKITLDVHDTVSQVSLSVKRRETGRRLLIHMADNGYPYHIGNDCYAVFTARKPDGKVIFNECTIDDCVIVYEFTEQTTAAAGMMECEIQLYGADSRLIVGSGFTIIVEDTIYDEDTEVESTSEFSALTALISEVQELKKELGSGKRKVYVTLPAANWVGEDSLYSQVVEIEGITEFSQVDPNLSAEQVNEFMDKALAFVIENEEGVVTVFAIGDKPVNDHVIQCTITEVRE